eukprot:scaffold115737_cov66-Phaeocystis_antarctica.AAC.8
MLAGVDSELAPMQEAFGGARGNHATNEKGGHVYASSAAIVASSSSAAIVAVLPSNHLPVPLALLAVLPPSSSGDGTAAAEAVSSSLSARVAAARVARVRARVVVVN